MSTSINNLNTGNFSEIDSALRRLEDVLHCNNCNVFMDVPVTLWACDHAFCQECIKNHNQCPKCQLPLWAQDQVINRRLTSISSLVVQLQYELQKHIKKEYNSEYESKKENLNQAALKPSISTSTQQALKHRNSVQSATKRISSIKPNIVKKQKKCSNFTEKLQNTSTFNKSSSTKVKKSAKFCNSGQRTPKLCGKNARGETQIHIASINGDLEKVEMLIKENVDINVKDNAGWTPLHEACNRGHIDVVKKLLEAGALVDIPGYENETPLIDAVVNNRTDVIKLLLEHGANLNLRNSDGKTALDLATTSEIKDLLSLYVSEHCIEQNLLKELSLSPASFFVIAYSTATDVKKVKSLSVLLKAKIQHDNAINCTHFIVPTTDTLKTKRTLKFLQAMTSGAWIVNERWVEKCLHEQQWKSELDFQLQGSYEDTEIDGPRRSITAKLQHLPRLFDGCHFFLHGNFSSPFPNKQQLAELIKASAGQLLTREPKPDNDIVQACRKVPYHATPNTAQYYLTYYIVYDPLQRQVPRLIHQGKVCSVPVSWLLACLSQFVICDVF